MEDSTKIKRATTLLVDDDHLIRDALRLAFKNQGRFIQTFESAEEALRILEKVSFDIIISDFELPGISGLEFLKQVKTSHPHSVALLISAHGDDEIVKRTYEIGVHDFLQKPFSLRTLWATMAMHILKRNGHPVRHTLKLSH